MTTEKKVIVKKKVERLSNRNLWSFSLGGIGRDLMYQLFNTYMLTCILLTKGVNTAEFAIVGVVIMCCRIFDALNDPIMGSIVDKTRTKWGKCRPYLKWMAIPIGVMTIICFLPVFKAMDTASFIEVFINTVNRMLDIMASCLFF